MNTEERLKALESAVKKLQNHFHSVDVFSPHFEWGMEQTSAPDYYPDKKVKQHEV